MNGFFDLIFHLPFVLFNIRTRSICPYIYKDSVTCYLDKSDIKCYICENQIFTGMKKRLRKKLCTGEFRELYWAVKLLKKEASDEEIETFFNDFCTMVSSYEWIKAIHLDANEDMFDLRIRFAAAKREQAIETGYSIVRWLYGRKEVKVLMAIGGMSDGGFDSVVNFCAGLD